VERGAQLPARVHRVLPAFDPLQVFAKTESKSC
jgi:hypothetical protein